LATAFKATARAGQRLLQTVQGIIDLSRIETGSFEARPTTLKLASLVEERARAFRGEADAKSLSLTCEIEDFAVEVPIDEYCVIQSIDRLLDNAIKFTKQGGVVIALRRVATGVLCLSIRDTGIGIDPAFLPRVFEPFSQQEQGYTRNYEGPGIGLALAKRFLQINGAELSVESEMGKGTAFTIRFPKASVAPDATTLRPTPPPRDETSPKAPSRARETPKPEALVVEDDEPSQRYAATILGRRFDVRVAAGAAEARAELETHPGIALILMDLSLKGGEDGLALTRWLRTQARWRALPIVVTTAHALPEDEENARNAGCTAYLAKPFLPGGLSKVIDSIPSFDPKIDEGSPP
jgi:CheY-like chemotaxis protein